MHFDAHYREVVALRDGSAVVLRAVRADDKDRLRAGFARLSPDARYLRFHGVKTALTDDELRYLTELDGVTHVALAALRAGGDGAEEGVGVARFVRLADEPGVAEAAITVLDEMQGKGLGAALFVRLVAAAAERGVERFRCEVLGSNTGMQALLEKIALTSSVKIESGVMTIDVQLPGVPADQPVAEPPRDSGLYALFRLVARGTLRLGDELARLVQTEEGQTTPEA
jgi:GNAT superfamily N-acetyltransferase